MALQLNPSVISRQDLLALKTNPTGFIGQLVLPDLPVMQWSGSRPFSRVSTSTGASGRDGSGNVVTTTINAYLPPFDMSSGEIIDREGIGQAEIAMFGGTKEGCEIVQAFSGTLKVRTSVETIVKTAMLANPVDIKADVSGGLLAAVLGMRPFGRVAIAGNVQAFNTLRALPNIKELMKATGVEISDTTDVRSISARQLAAIFRADECYEAITASVIWDVNKLVVYVIPDANVDPSAVPQVGRLLKYNWSLEPGKTIDMICEELYDVNQKKNVLDFTAYAQAIIANAAFKSAVTIA